MALYHFNFTLAAGDLKNWIQQEWRSNQQQKPRWSIYWSQVFVFGSSKRRKESGFYSASARTHHRRLLRLLLKILIILGARVRFARQKD